MESKELRIGNYVNFAEENVLFQVVEIDSEGLTVENKTDKTWIELETFEGVKITEEWLIKFGFKKGVKGWFKTIDRNLKFNLYMYHKDLYKYVHQLQNLYFALRGEELK